MTANHSFCGLHHLKIERNKPLMSMSALGQELVLLLLVVLASAEDEEDAAHIVYANGATSERNLPVCAGPREACNVVRQRFWLSPAVYRMCKCPDRTNCPAEFTDLSDNRTIAFNARAQLKFCSRVREIEECKGNTEAAAIGLNGTIHIYCFCGPNNFYQRLYRNSTGQYFKCKQLGSCQKGDFCGHIATASSYETYHVCTCPRRHICILQNRNKVYTDEFLYRGPAYRGHCVPR